MNNNEPKIYSTKQQYLPRDQKAQELYYVPIPTSYHPKKTTWYPMMLRFSGVRTHNPAAKYLCA